MQRSNTNVTSQQTEDSKSRQQSYNHMNYKNVNSSTDILVAIFKDMYENGRPSSSLSPLMSSYASMRLGVYADSTNSVPLVQTSDDYYGSNQDNGYFLRGANNASNFETNEYQRLSKSNTWLTALTWGPREAGMLALTSKSQTYIENADTTVEYLTAIAHEWHQYGFDISLTPGALNYETFYIRSGSDAIFRITSHLSQRFVSKSSKTADTGFNEIVGDNHLHIASIWDTAREQWLLLGIFLCPQGLAFDSAWSDNPKLADAVYLASLVKVPNDKKIDVNTPPDIIVTAASSRSSTASIEKAVAGIEKDKQTSTTVIEESEEESDDSGYWDQYDDISGSEGDGEETEREQNTDDLASARQQVEGFSIQNDHLDDDSYYNSYADVEHMIHGDDVDRSPAPKVGMLESLVEPEPSDKVTRAASPVWPGAFPTTKTIFTNVESPSNIKCSEIKQESPKNSSVNSVKTHVSESIKSLYKLAHSQGISVKEFMELASDAVKSIDI